ncbi:MAG: 2-oxoacid:ferredoxin oxidoreductase subunit beta, partial [Deltaproteobacteria bacterium]|nr:2-oxoacid:ferredoxin oxidoreductase subunit beta [Deltaproteobacteria bacterium]
LAIGGNHLIHAARKNIGLTALILNNNIYGMTGGQKSPTSPFGSVTSTSPFGQIEKDFDVVELLKAAGANYVARSTVMHVNLMDRLLQEALTKPGFNVLEVMTPCHTQYGRKNKFKTNVEMYKWYKKTAMPLDRFLELPPDKQKDRIPIGVFADRGCPGLEERYYGLKERLTTGGTR